MPSLSVPNLFNMELLMAVSKPYLLVTSPTTGIVEH